MSTAAAVEDATEATAPKKKGKKLFILMGVGLLVLGLAGGGGTMYVMKQRAAQAAAEDDDGHAVAEKRDVKKATPSFVALDPFTVNLADPKADRFAQVSISLELDDVKTVDLIKSYMPVIRNNVLMVISQKSSAELLERDGKIRLAQELQVATLKALGVDMPVEAAAPAAGGSAPAAGEPARVSPRKAKAEPAKPLPVQGVHFANFIIQ